MQPVFFFHGLMPEGSNPTNQMITSLSLQSVANEYNMMFILPVSQVWDLVGQRFHLWNIEQGTEVDDLTLYDDLRTCVAEHFDVYNSDQIDLGSMSSMGFSGGALFTTVVLSNRPETLASVIEMSGGGDLEVPGFANPFSVHNPTERDVPTLLMSGGAADVYQTPVLRWLTSTLPVPTSLKNSKQPITQPYCAPTTMVTPLHKGAGTKHWNG